MTSTRGIRLAARQHSPEWDALHLDGVSSSQIPLITGNRPGLLELWGVQTGLLEPKEPDAALAELFEIGTLMEPVLAELYTRRTGRPVKVVNQMLQSREIPWIRASLDRESRRKSEFRIVELKWAPYRKWSEETETVPANVQDQIQFQLYVSRADVADCGVMEKGKFRVEEIGPDQAYIDDLLYLAKWYRDLVIRKERPPVDGSAASHAALRRLYPFAGPELDKLYGHDDVWDEIAAMWPGAQWAVKIANAELSALKATVKALLGDSPGIESEPGEYAFTYRNDRTFDWEAIARELNAPADLVAMHTHTDWKAVAETLRPRAKLKDAHATLSGKRVLRFKSRKTDAHTDAPAEEEQVEEATAA